MSENEWTKILGWAGYRVYRSEIEEEAKRLQLWARRKLGNRKLPQTGVFRLCSEISQVAGSLRARARRPAVVGAPDDGGNRALWGALSGLRNQGGESTAVAE